MSKNISTDDRVMMLVTQLQTNPKGVTITQIAADQNVGVMRAYGVLSALRELLGSDKYNVIGTGGRRGQGQMVYILTGDAEEARPYMHFRKKRAHAEATACMHIISSLASGVDGRTTQGRYLADAEESAKRLVHDLERSLAFDA